uniref:RNA1 polyprotein n=1 Tax=Peach leaf pitting-associated virus TaxID=2038685 RepID=A0A5B8YXS4_9SECO|nr:polyprotein [Peach leaf pitting-associated virus]
MASHLSSLAFVSPRFIADKTSRDYFQSFSRTLVLGFRGDLDHILEFLPDTRLYRRHSSLARLYAFCVLGVEVEERNWDDQPHLCMDEIADILEDDIFTRIKYHDMFNFVRGTMLFYLDFDYASEQDPSEGAQDGIFVGQGLVHAVTVFSKKFPSMLYDKATSFLGGCVSGVWKLLEDCFNKAFGAFCPHIYSALGWVKNAFKSFQAWTEHLVEESVSWLCEARECVLIGLALTSMTCLVALLERFLIATGLMAASLGLPMLFLTVSLGAICGYKVLSTMATDKENGMVANLVEMVKSTCMSLLETLWPSVHHDARNQMFQFAKESKEKRRAQVIAKHQQKLGRSEPLTQEMHSQQEWNNYCAGKHSSFQQRFGPYREDEWEKYFSGEPSIYDAYFAAEMEGQFSPLCALEGVAASVSGWNTSALVGAGRTCAAFSQIKNGAVALKDILAYICNKLYDCADSVFGLQSAILNDAAVLLGQDLPKWLKECDAMVDYMHIFSVAPRDVVDRMQKLLSQGRAMRTAFVNSDRRGSAQVLSLISKAVEKLETLYHGAILAGSNLPRKAPFFLFLTGDSGVGKSSLTQKLSRDWLAHFEMGQDCRYPRNSQDPFWSGYRRQALVTYDDFGAIQKEPSDEAEIIPIVSRDPYSLNMASLEEKGMFFDSRLMIASSNFLAASPNSQIHDVAAYERRRHMVIQVELKPGVPYSEDDPTMNQRYILRESRAHFQVIQVFESYEDFWTFFLNKFDEHEEKERNFLKTLDMPSGDQTTAVSAMLTASAVLLAYAPGSIQAHIAQHHKDFHYLAVYEGILYMWNARDELKKDILKGKIEQEDILRAERDSYSAALQFEYVLRSFPHLNPLAVHYTMEIVKNGWLNADLSISSKCPDDFTRTMLNGFHDWQKQYMYILSATHLSAEGAPFFQNLLVDLKRQVCRLYTTDFKRWNPLLKLAFGCVLALAIGGSIYTLMSSLWQCGTGAKFAIAATGAFATGQSVPPNRQEVTEYKFRNVPFKAKHWSKGQACFGDSAAWIMDQCMVSLTYGSYVAQACVLPYNQLVGVNHFLRVIPTGVTVKVHSGQGDYWITWNQKNLRCAEDAELAVYTSPQIRLVNTSLMDRVLWDVEKELPSMFEATYLSFEYYKDSQQYVPEIAKVDVRVVKAAHTIHCGSYVRVVPKYMTFEAPTVDGNCGSLIVAHKDGKAFLVGLHIAGNGTHGCASFMPEIQTHSVAQFNPNMNERIEHFDVPGSIGNGCYQVGFLTPENRYRISTKTSLVETPPEYHLGTPCEKIPSVITKDDPRLIGTEHGDFNPYVSGMEKYAQEAGPFDSDLLDVVCAEIVDEWVDASSSFTFEDATLDEAINGVENLDYFDSLVINTSEGYPYVLERNRGEKGKSRYLEGEVGNLKISPDSQVFKDVSELYKQCEHEVPELVGIECPKDEKVARRKVFLKPKTRLFTVLPMSYNLVVRMKFLRFVRFLMKRRDVLPCQVGINPYSLEWHRLGSDLQTKGNNILCCDYSRFDGFLPKVVMEKIADMINKLCGGSPSDCRQRKNLLMACTGRFAICDKVVYRVENGIPSGFPLTVILNSILNEILVRYVYRETFAENKIVAASFRDYVKMVTYGDDNLISVHDTISNVFDGKRIKDRMEQLHITITDGVDKTLPTLHFRPLESCDFLKRTFRRQQGFWVGPMEKESLWGQLHYVNTKNLEMREAYLTNVESVLRELYLHSKKECADLRHKVLQLKWVLPGDVPTLDKIEAFYADQRGETRPFSLSCDIMLNPTLLGALKEEAPLPVGMMEVLPQFCVAQTKTYVKGDNDFLVRIDHYGHVENSLTFRFPKGEGRGGLPTKRWICENVLRKGCNIRKAISQQLQEGKRIVFISPNDNTIGLVFVALIATTLGYLQRDSSNVLLSLAIKSTKTLGYLPEIFSDYF